MSRWFLPSFALVAIAFLLAGVPVSAQEKEEPAPKGEGQAGALKQNMLDLEKMKGERDKIGARIKQIDAIIIPVQEKIVVEVVGLDLDEYRSLKAQADNPAVGGKYFPSLRKAYTADIGGAALYFDEAYDALSKGKLWVGREERLIEEDVKLSASIELEINDAMAKLPNGEALMALIKERADLIAKLNASSPLFNYLTERRRWWTAYPDYINTLKNDREPGSAQPAAP